MFWHAGQSALRGGSSGETGHSKPHGLRRADSKDARASRRAKIATERRGAYRPSLMIRRKLQRPTTNRRPGNKPYMNAGSDKENPYALDNICNPAGALAARRRQFVHVGRIHPHLACPGAGRVAYPRHSGPESSCVATKLFSPALSALPPSARLYRNAGDG